MDRLPEIVIPFYVPESEVTKLSVGTDRGGYLELYIAQRSAELQACACYLFRGDRTVEQAENAKGSESHPDPSFDLVATQFHPAVMRVEPGLGMVTLYADNNDVRGFLRWRCTDS